MRRRHAVPEPPRGWEDVELIRSGRDGVWWQRRDGLRMQLAAPEHEPVVERGRLSLLAVLLAMIASGRARP